MTDSSVTGRNQNHSDIRDESARDNDPLFELSRIFGFDEPVAQTNIQNTPAADDLSSEISLERELMADFDAEFAADFGNEQYSDQLSEPQGFDNSFAPEVSSGTAPQAAAPQDMRESRYAPPAEPRFTGYAPLQRAYAEEKAPAVPEQPVFTQPENIYQEEPHYYAPEPVQEAQGQDAYYAAYSDLPHDPAFSEPQQAQGDYFSAGETGADNAEFDMSALEVNDFGLGEVGREPQPEFAPQDLTPSNFAPSYDDATHYQQAVAPQAYQPEPAYAAAAEPSLEDELAFLLHDGPAAPQSGDQYVAPAAVQDVFVAPQHEEPVAPAYQEPVNYTQPAYGNHNAPDNDFEPLFDAPTVEVAPVASAFDLKDETVADHAVEAENAGFYAQVEDEFFEAPDLSRLPNRNSAFSAHRDEVPVEEPVVEAAVETPAVRSFADLFGATSQPAYEPEPATEDYASEPVYAADEQTESFNFDEDFFAPEEQQSVAPAVEEPVMPPLSSNAVRGYSSYTFGAATPAAGMSNTTSLREAVAPVQAPAFETAPESAPQSFAQNITGQDFVADSDADFFAAGDTASEDFFANDDFNFSFDEDVQPADDYAAPVAEQVEEQVAPAFEPSFRPAAKSFEPAPEIDVVAVAENKVEQTQALDLPDISFDDEVKETGLNSLESEFAEIFSTISVSEAAPDTTSEADKAFENILQDNFADYQPQVKAATQTADDSGFDFAAAAGVAAAGIGAAAAGYKAGTQNGAQNNVAAANASQDDYYNHWAAQGAQANDFDAYNLGENFARDEDAYEDYQPRAENPLRKPILWVSVAAALLIAVGGGYYLLKSGGVVGGEPEVLRADTQPVKVQPENPGGTVVPNQDKAVYEQVSGTKPVAPEQKELINTEEEPVDVGLLQGQDAEEDRLLSDDGEATLGTTTPPADEAERELITPRTVKTMVVRADGTLVESEAPKAPAAQNNADNGLDEASRLISQSAVPERLTNEKPANSAQNAAAPRVVQTQTFTASGEQVKPREVTTAPVVPSRPAEQPVNVVGNVERPAQNQTQNQAAPQVANANVPAGTWFIQVASQPSAELAQKNYANLSSRYGNIIGGRGVDIKKADIPGKGTYYRVRIPGGTKAEAAALCERLKSAGGSCFPTL